MKLQISILLSMAVSGFTAPQSRKDLEELLEKADEGINVIDVGQPKNQVKEFVAEVPLGSQFAVQHLFPERVGLVTGHRIPIELFPIETQSRVLEAPSVSSIRVPSDSLEPPKVPKSTPSSINLKAPRIPTRVPGINLEVPKVPESTVSLINLEVPKIPKSTASPIDLEVPTVPTRAPGVSLKVPSVPTSTVPSVDLEVPGRYVDTSSFRRGTTARDTSNESLESPRLIPEILQPRGEFDKTYERTLRIFHPPSLF